MDSVVRWGKCGDCRFFAPELDGSRGVCARFELQPRADRRGGLILYLRRRGELRGSELLVGAAHGCSAFEIDAKALQSALQEAFNLDGSPPLPNLLGTVEMVIRGGEIRDRLAAWCGEAPPPEAGGTAMAAAQRRLCELLVEKTDAGFWAGGEWRHEIFRVCYRVLKEREASNHQVRPPVLPALVGEPDWITRGERERADLLEKWLELGRPGPAGLAEEVLEVVAAAQARLGDLLSGRTDAKYWAEGHWRSDFFGS